jgi:hypothetical protein
VVSGSFEGKRLKGKVLSGGGDWLLAGEDGFARLDVVPTKNSKSIEKSRVLGITAVVSPACMRLCVRSFRFLPADSVAGR